MIADNIEAARERIRRACDRAGRRFEEVKIMAVTKSVGAGAIREAADCGIALFGENRVQEGKAKVSQGAFAGAIPCMIGHLQTNKASLAVRMFGEIHSVDSPRLADAVSRYGALYRAPGSIPVYMEVNIAGDPAKHGVSAEDALPLAQHICRSPYLRLAGLMTVAPGYGDLCAARRAFRALRELRDRLIGAGIEAERLAELSMGMSGDFDVAVEEGSTVVRLGTALFGPRQ